MRVMCRPPNLIRIYRGESDHFRLVRAVSPNEINSQVHVRLDPFAYIPFESWEHEVGIFLVHLICETASL